MSLTNALHRILRPETTAYARCLTAQPDSASRTSADPAPRAKATATTR